MKRRRILQSLAAVLVTQAWGAPAWASAYPRAAAVPGGVARIRLGAAERAPRVLVERERVLVVREDGKWVALVGIALTARPGSKVRLEVEHADGKREQLEVKVAAKAYASQHLKVPPGQVELSAEDLARHERERAHLREVLRTFSDAAPATLAMLQPAPGRRSSAFGLQRYFNGSNTNGLSRPEPRIANKNPIVIDDRRDLDTLGDQLRMLRVQLFDRASVEGEVVKPVGHAEGSVDPVSYSWYCLDTARLHEAEGVRRRRSRRMRGG